MARTQILYSPSLSRRSAWPLAAAKLWCRTAFALVVLVALVPPAPLVRLAPLAAQEVAETPESLYQQGLSAMESKEYQRAKDLLLQSVRRRNDYLEAYLVLGQVLEALGDDSTALKSYTKAISIDKRAFAAYFGYADIMLRQNNPKVAWYAYSAVIALDARNAQAYKLRGDLLLPYVPFLSLLDYDQAIALQSGAAEILHDLYSSRALANYAQRRWQDAADDYRQLLKQNKRDGKAYLGLGRSQLRLYQYTQAKRSFVAAQRYKVDSFYIPLGLAAVTAVQGSAKKAKDYFDQALAQAPDKGRAELYWRRGQWNQEQKLLDQAEADYNKAVELAPKNFEVYLQRGRFYQQQERYSAALADYNASIASLSRNLFRSREGELLDQTELLLPFQYRGDVQFLLGQYDAALESYQVLLQRQVENTDVYQGLGSAQAGKEDFSDALASYERAIALLPTTKGQKQAARPYYLRGAAKAQMGDMEAGFVDLDTAVKLEPRNPRPYYYQGLFYAEQEDYSQAIAKLKKAIRLDKSEPQYGYALAAIYYQQGTYSEALSSLNKLIDKAARWPGASKLHALRARVYFQLGEFEPALVDAATALKTRPQVVDLYALQAEIYSSRGQGDLALNSYTQGLEIVPESALLYRGRALIYRQLEQLPEALADINTALEIKPEDTLNLFYQSVLLAQNGKLDQALAAIERALALQPERRSFLLQWANLKIKLGEDAEPNVMQVLSADNQGPLAQYYLGYLAFRRGDLTQAAEKLSLAYRADTSNPLYIYNYALILLAQGNVKEAAKLFNSLLKENNAYSAKGHYGKGMIALQQGKYKAALRLFEVALNQVSEPGKPGSLPEPLALIARGDTYLKLEQYSPALQDFQAYLQGYGQSAEALRFIGDALRLQGSLKEAYAAYQKALQLDDLVAASYYGRGAVLLANKNYDLALPNFVRAIELDGQQPSYYVGRAAVRVAQENDAAALEDLQTAQKHDPDYAELYRLQADIYTRLGDKDAASKAQKNYKRLSR